MSNWRSVANALISTLFAPPCAICGTILDAPLSGAMCPSCWAIIDRLAPHRFAIPPAIRHALALGEYDGVLRDAIHALKYDGRRTIGPGLSRMMAKQALPLLQGADVEVTGSGDELMVNGANVICGGVQTANATVYLIDSVLMPPAQ